MTSSNHHPDFKKVMLASVKEDLYHPRLPSLRRMDMDDVNHRLPQQHSRTATSCGPRDFKSATSSFFKPCEYPLGVSNTVEKNDLINQTVNLKSVGVSRVADLDDRYWASGAQKNWSRLISTLGEFNLNTKETEKDDFRFSHYAVRHFKPEVTQSWRYTLVQEPTLDQFGRKPMPANVYARYRDTFPQFSRNISQEAWR